MPPEIKLTWHGHACFTLEADGYRVVVDPYAPGTVPGLAPLALRAQAVLCSHGHDDHGYTKAVALEAGPPCPFTIATIPTYHDARQGADRGGNTIHVLEAHGLRVAHLGDLGHLLRPADLEALGRVDCLLVPVGGFFTIDPAQACAVAQACSAKVVVPMHFRGLGFGYDQIETVDTFLALRRDVLPHPGNTLVLTAATPAQTALLQLEG